MTSDVSAEGNRWGVSALFTANGFILGAWAPQIPLFLTRHNITEGTLGLLILCLGLGAVGAMLFAGRLIAAHGSRRVAAGFGLAAVPMLALVVLAPNLWLLAPLMAIMGGVIGCMDVAMNANAVLVERRMGRAIMSASHGFWSLGGFIGGSAGSYLIAIAGPYVQVAVATVITAALVIGGIPYMLKDAPTGHAAGDAAPKHQMFARDKGLWILGAMALFSMVPEGAVLDWAAIYMGKELGADVMMSGLGFAFFAGAMAIMRFAGDGVRNRFGAVKTLQVSGLLGAAGLLVGGVAPNGIVAIIGFTLAGFGVANMIPILFSAAGNRPGLPPGVGISTVTMVGYAGILIAPSSIGFVAEHIGFRTTYIALAAVLAVVAMMANRAAAADDLQRD
jgi:fucose permease